MATIATIVAALKGIYRLMWASYELLATANHCEPLRTVEGPQREVCAFRGCPGLAAKRQSMPAAPPRDACGAAVGSLGVALPVEVGVEDLHLSIPIHQQVVAAASWIASGEDAS
jgi:hypothetical protein